MKSPNSFVSQIFAKNYRPPPRISVTEFADIHRRSSAETSANTGRWKTLPYQREMQDAFLKYKIIVYMTATQVGKTEIIKNQILYSVANFSGGLTFLLPSESLAKDYSKAQIGPLIRDTPILRAKIGDAKKNGNTHLFKSYKNGYLRFVGANSGDKLSSFPSPMIWCDELDRAAAVTRNSNNQIEGSTIDIILERSKNWHRRCAVFTSTPTIEGASTIQFWFDKSDQRYPFIPCPNCGFFQFLAWDRFTWPGKGEKNAIPVADHFGFECASCSKIFDDKTRDIWLPELKWEAQNRSPNPEIAGFHLNAFYSPFSSWRSLFEKYVAAGNNHINRMVFWNTTLGLPFSFEAIKTPEWQKLSSREHTYKRYFVPKIAKVLLAAVDVQFDRLEVSVIAFYRSQTFVITHEIILGNTSSLDSECWEELDELLSRTWERIDGIKMQIHRVAIDAHFHTNTVAQYARSRKKLIPVTGVDNWKDEILAPRALDIKQNGRYIRSGKRRWPIGVSLFKLDLYNRLKLEPNSDGTFPNEYVHFAEGLSEEYFKQITGEVCKIEQDQKGRPKMVWQKQHEAVEALDCFVYCLALFKICGIHMWSDERWA